MRVNARFCVCCAVDHGSSTFAQVELRQHGRMQDANDQDDTVGVYSVEDRVLTDERSEVRRNLDERSPGDRQCSESLSRDPSGSVQLEHRPIDRL